jgi:hypothetical protein
LNQRKRLGRLSYGFCDEQISQTILRRNQGGFFALDEPAKVAHLAFERVLPFNRDHFLGERAPP